MTHEVPQPERLPALITRSDALQSIDKSRNSALSDAERRRRNGDRNATDLIAGSIIVSTMIQFRQMTNRVYVGTLSALNEMAKSAPGPVVEESAERTQPATDHPLALPAGRDVLALPAGVEASLMQGRQDDAATQTSASPGEDHPAEPSPREDA
jgi:hypothetical protein